MHLPINIPAVFFYATAGLAAYCVTVCVWAFLSSRASIRILGPTMMVMGTFFVFGASIIGLTSNGTHLTVRPTAAQIMAAPESWDAYLIGLCGANPFVYVGVKPCS